MTQHVTPVDVLMMSPEQLDRLNLQGDMDNALVDSLRWGYAFHPNEVSRLRAADPEVGATIDWSFSEAHEDVHEAIRNATVLADIPIAGVAEHLVALRRFTNAQAEEIRQGESWREGTTSHLACLFGQK